MAFTDPILAGEELVRDAIRSENYIPGVSGWRIAGDGAAEFDNVGIRGNLWVPTITLNGQDLATQLDNMPKGVIAFISGYPVVSTTSEARCMLTDANIVRGRYYEVFAVNMSTDISAAEDTAFRIRWEYGADPPIPTTGSGVICESGRQSVLKINNLNYKFWSGETARVRFALFIVSATGGNVRTWSPGGGCSLGLIDLGKAPYDHPGQGTVGTGIIPKVLKEWTITANSSKTYLGNGTQRTDQYESTLIAGDWANGKGNQRSWFTFSSADVSSKINDLVGVPLADIVTAEVNLRPLEYYNYATLSGYFSIGFHNTINGLATTEPGGGVPNVHRPAAYERQWHNIDLKPPCPSNFLDSLRDGYMKGFMLGNTFSGPDYRVVCEGYGWTGAPQLHMKYWK